MSQASAWLLKSKIQEIALGKHEIIEVLTEPDLQPIPAGPEYCRHIVFWQDKILPVVELDKLNQNSLDKKAPINKDIVIVAWQNAPGEPLEHGAISISSLPESIQVDDNQQVELPESVSEQWKKIVLSVFSLNENIVLIPDLKRIFVVEENL